MSNKGTATRPQYKQGKRVNTGNTNRVWWIVTAVVVVIGIALVATLATGSNSTKADAPTSAALLKKVTSIPARVFTEVGAGATTASPKPISAPALTADGKPHILYIGAEYCPFCAAERWPTIIALSRFGTFTGLRTTRSSSTDSYPNTATFSFHGASYTSKWISFTGIETETNQRQGDGYKPLEKLTAAQQQLFATYDAPPYTTSNGGIPFIDFGGKFVISGASYDPGVLSGKSADAIATALSDPTSAISKGAIGAANTMTAAICLLTQGQPASVCSGAAIAQLEGTLQ